jgi:hypothetical protein
MADDREAHPGDRRDNRSVFGAIEALREDVREDVGHLRDDMREDLKTARDEVRHDLAAIESRMMTTLTDYIRVHSDDHTAQRRESQAAHERFTEFVRGQEIAQARKDGAIGVARYAIELLSRHAKPLGMLLVSAAAFLGVASGAIQIEIVAR